jgi:hypothetical protein
LGGAAAFKPGEKNEKSLIVLACVDEVINKVFR